MNGAASLTHALADKSVAQHMNLTVLQRIDAQIDQILAAPGHVALYGLDATTNTWARLDVEGSLFLLLRRSEPYFQFFVLNKKSQENYVESLFDGLRTELTPPYLYYTNQHDQVVGIWFYEVSECVKLEDLIERLRAIHFSPASFAKQSAGATAAPLLVPARQDDGFWDKPATVSHSSADVRLKQDDAAPVPAPALRSGAAPAPLEDTNELTRLFAKIRTTLPPSPLKVQTSVAAQPKREPPPPTPFPGFPALQSHVPRSDTPPQIAAPPPSASLAMAAPAHVPLTMQLQQPPRPNLVTPSFFQTQRQQAAAAKSAEKGTSSEVHGLEAALPSGRPPGSSGIDNGNALTDLFARATKPAVSREGIAAGRSADLHSAGATINGGASPARLAQREHVRRAMVALASSDEFVDIVVKHLSAAGALDS